MKSFIVIVALFNCIITEINAQVVKDKNAFAQAFIKIFNESGSGFDTLIAKEVDDYFEPKIKLPNASECFISMNHVYGAVYNFSDSLKGLAFFKEIQSLLNYTASLSGATARFETIYSMDDFFIRLYFLEPAGFTNNYMSIKFSKYTTSDDEFSEEEEDEEKPIESSKPIQNNSDSFEVRLLLHPGASYCYYTSFGEKINDVDFKNFISQVAFGKDTALKAVKINKRIVGTKNIYDSKTTIKGFTTTITEIKDTKLTGIYTHLIKNYYTTEENFFKSVDSVILKLKAALPEYYCYEILPKIVEFKPSLFAVKKDNDAEITLQYTAIENMKNAHKIEIYIHRKFYNDR